MSKYLSSKFRSERSYNDYKPDVLKSGLQKYIRRNVVDKALYCAAELDLFKEDEERGETIRTNFIHRLMIIFMEDVGIGGLNLLPHLDKWIDALLKERNKSKRDKVLEENLITTIVTKMCESEKSRSCSHIRAVGFVDDKDTRKVAKLKYLDVEKIHNEFDEMYTKYDDATLNELASELSTAINNKNMIAFIVGFKMADMPTQEKAFYNGKKKPVWKIFEVLSKKFNIANVQYFKIFEKWFIELQSLKENFMCWMLPMMMLMYDLKISPMKDAVILNGRWEKSRKGETIEFDDYVLDRHTSAGRDKSLVEFAIHGAHVENESGLVNKMWKKFYEDMKYCKEFGYEYIVKYSPPKSYVIEEESEEEDEEDEEEEEEEIIYESKKYEFIVRTQLNTTGMKSDVYFAIDNDTKKMVVVKGPLSDYDAVRNVYSMYYWKKKNNIATLQVDHVKMIPDRWPEGVPLGLRNKMKRDEPADFLVFESLIKKDEIIEKVHKSKVWPDTKIVDWSKVDLHLKLDELDDEQMQKYVELLLMRYVFGISDLADRNFLVKNDKIYSIDEEYKGKCVSIYLELKKNKCKKIRDWLEENYEKLMIKEWKDIKGENKIKYSKIIDKAKCLKLFEQFNPFTINV